MRIPIPGDPHLRRLSTCRSASERIIINSIDKTEGQMVRKVLIAALIAASLGSVSLPVAAAVYVQVAPPAARVEAVPAPRHGYIWAPGYWDWNGRRYNWVSGNWVRTRPGYRYASPVWVARNGRWYKEGGRWARDRDRDGVPNRFDRHPNNPNRP